MGVGVGVYVHALVCVCIARGRACRCAGVQAYGRAYVRRYICMYMSVCLCLSLSVCMSICICMHACTYVSTSSACLAQQHRESGFLHILQAEQSARSARDGSQCLRSLANHTHLRPHHALTQNHPKSRKTKPWSEIPNSGLCSNSQEQLLSSDSVVEGSV